MKNVKIQFSGGFHRANALHIMVSEAAIDVLFRRDEKFDRRWGESKWERIQGLMGSGFLSEWQRKKIWRHMCGVDGCLCEIRHGWEVESPKAVTSPRKDRVRLRAREVAK